MEEFDTEHTGCLSHDDFIALAALVEKEYELSDDPYNGYNIIGDYRLMQSLGRGAEGIVKCCMHMKTDERRACKIIKRGDVACMSRIDREIKAMTVLRHPNVVRLHEVLEDEEHIYVIMDINSGGELLEHLDRKHPLSDEMARFYMCQLCDAVAYCHQKGVAHRDLRLENLMLDNRGEMKVTDFGHAGIFTAGWDIFQTMMVGAMSHIAPEQIHGQAYSGEKLDVWSMGVILYHMLHGRGPFEEENLQVLLDKICLGAYETCSENVDVDAKHLISQLIQVHMAMVQPALYRLYIGPCLSI